MEAGGREVGGRVDRTNLEECGMEKHSELLQQYFLPIPKSTSASLNFLLTPLLNILITHNVYRTAASLKPEKRGAILVSKTEEKLSFPS